MLSRLSIRDIVLIDRLDIDFAAGLAVLTGETGAGKSILLDAFALALGARGDQSQREGIEQDRLAGAGLAGEHGKPRGKIDVEPVDQNDVADRESGEHELSKSYNTWSCPDLSLIHISEPT